MSAAHSIISACKKARQTGPDSWVACCPAHEDKNPSMTVRETPEGMVLVHCFAGCSLEDICGAVGVKVEDLFPEKLERTVPKFRGQPFSAADVLRCLATEALVAAVIASDMHTKGSVSEVDRKRLWVAATRLRNAKDIALGS